MIGRFALVCLDMAGTTIRDDGAVDAAFTSALAQVGITPEEDRFAEARRFVHETMGWSKADVFAALLPRSDATRATTAFADAYEALGWTTLVDLALSPADAGRGRPAPDMILGAMERLGVPDPGAVAVVGDTVSDLEAGAAAHAGAVIGVLSGAHDEATLAQVPHSALIDDVRQLLPVLVHT